MSSFFKPSGYTDHQKETQWLNSILGIHDIFCFCDQPWMHLMQSILQRNNFFDIKPKQQRLIQQCLLSITTEEKDTSHLTEENNGTRTNEKDGFDLDIGDLEKLFEEDDKNG